MNKTATLLALASSIALVATDPAKAQYPEKPVTIVVPYPAGGTTDILARIVGERLSEEFGQPFVIENKPGASGAVGMASVAQESADGYTLVSGNINTHGINPALRDDLPYDPVADFAPIALLAQTPNVMLANKDSGYASVSDVVERAKADPGSISFGSTAIGGSPHMSGELLKSLAGIDMVHIPYQGGGPMLAAVVGGEVPVAFDNMPSASEQIRAGTVVPLAVTTSERWPEHPDIPTFQEAGIEDYEVSAWFGLFAPDGTPGEVIDMLGAAIGEMMQDEETRSRLMRIGAQPSGMGPEEFSTYMEAETERWQQVAAEADISLQ